MANYATQAGATGGGTAAVFRPLVTTSVGLVSHLDAASSPAPPTTGIAAAIGHGSGGLNMEIGGTVVSPMGGATVIKALGGLLIVEGLAAATYDIEVRFKSASGTISVKNRKLKVMAIGF
jgi:hypothetical protein